MPDKLLALVVEDDPETRTAMLEILDSEGFRGSGVGTLQEARERVKATPGLAVVLVDLDLPDGSGLQLLAADPPLEKTDIVVITGKATVNTVVTAFREGATDYLTKPVDVDHLVQILRDTRHRSVEWAEDVQTLESARKTGQFRKIIGSSPQMLAVYRQIQRVAPTEVSVLVQGETGTGKEMVAQTIHEMSRRVEQPFIALNCGAVSSTLIESELFGHEKGSFTGATKRHLGVFERAHGGTLFLDEITEMSPELQVKLLRVLESRSFSRVGGESMIHSDARMIAATNRDPQQAIRDGKLREDLFHRLRVFPISLPRLKERKGDVELLARRFLRRLNAENETEKTLGDDALSWLESQEWSGNVRELKNLMTRAWVMANEVIDLDAVSYSNEPKRDQDVPAASADELRIAVGSSIAEVEKALILATLDRFGGNKNTAARVLGISVKTLYNRLAVYAASGDA